MKASFLRTIITTSHIQIFNQKLRLYGVPIQKSLLLITCIKSIPVYFIMFIRILMEVNFVMQAKSPILRYKGGIALNAFLLERHFDWFSHCFMSFKKRLENLSAICPKTKMQIQIIKEYDPIFAFLINIINIDCEVQKTTVQLAYMARQIIINR